MAISGLYELQTLLNNELGLIQQKSPYRDVALAASLAAQVAELDLQQQLAQAQMDALRAPAPTGISSSELSAALASFESKITSSSNASITSADLTNILSSFENAISNTVAQVGLSTDDIKAQLDQIDPGLTAQDLATEFGKIQAQTENSRLEALKQAGLAQAEAIAQAAAITEQQGAEAIAEIQRQYDVGRADLAPFREAGLVATSQLLGLQIPSAQNISPAAAQIFPTLLQNAPQIGQTEIGQAPQIDQTQIGQTPTIADSGLTSEEEAIKLLESSPAYQFRLKEGNKAVQGSAAASGLLRSGSLLKELTSFGQELASTELGRLRERQLQEASLRQQQNISQAQLQQQNNLSQADLDASRRTQQAQLLQQNSLAQADISSQRALQQAQLQQQTGLAQADLDATRRLQQAQLQQNYNLQVPLLQQQLQLAPLQFQAGVLGQLAGLGTQSGLGLQGGQQQLGSSILGARLGIGDSLSNASLAQGQTLANTLLGAVSI